MAPPAKLSPPVYCCDSTQLSNTAENNTRSGPSSKCKPASQPAPFEDNATYRSFSFKW